MSLDDNIADVYTEIDADRVCADLMEALGGEGWVKVQVCRTKYLGRPGFNMVFEVEALGVASVFFTGSDLDRIMQNNDASARGAMFLVAGLQSLCLANTAIGEDDEEDDEEDESVGSD